MWLANGRAYVTLAAPLRAGMGDGNWDRKAAAQPVWFPKQGFMKRWRKYVVAHLLNQCSNQTLTDFEVSHATCGQLDVYEFGVFTGRALKAMAPILARHGVARSIWGFDSVRTFLAPCLWCMWRRVDARARITQNRTGIAHATPHGRSVRSWLRAPRHNLHPTFHRRTMLRICLPHLFDCLALTS